MCSPSLQLCLTALAVIFCLSSPTRADPIMSHEPVEHLKAHLPKKGDEMSDKLGAFLRSSQEEVNRKTAQIEKNLKKALKKEPHVSAILLKETTILAKRFPSGVQFNSTLLLPFGVLLPILSTTLPILLENYRPELLHNAIGNVLRGKDRDHKDVKDFLSLSLLDLVTKLPREGDAPDMTDPGLLLKLNRRGKAAVYCLNTILEKIAEDAWKDALMAVAMDYSAFSDTQQMLTNFKDLGMYAEATASDLVNFFEASQSDAYPLDAGHYLFGWWFNCPRGSSDGNTECMAPFLPRDSVAVLNPVIRIYSVPRLRLHLIVGNTGDSSQTRSVADVLRKDRLIWKAIYSAVDPTLVQEEAKKPEQDTETEDAAPEQLKEKRETKKDTSVGQEEEAPSKPPPTEAEPEKSPPTPEPKAERVEEEEKPTPAPATEQAEEQTPNPSAKEEKEDKVVGESTQDTETAAPSNSQPTESEKPPSQKPSAAADRVEDKEDEVVGESSEEGEGEGEEEREVTKLTRAIHIGWPIAVFTFYTIFSHVWVYWIVHLMWYLLSSVFSNIYLPRPKTAKQD